MMVGHKNIQGRFSLSNFECQHIFFSPSVSLHLFIFTEAACINVTRPLHIAFDDCNDGQRCFNKKSTLCTEKGSRRKVLKSGVYILLKVF